MTTGRLRSPVVLLAAQGVALGLLCGFVIIPASGIFLARYGSKGLPWVYLLVAIAGAVTSPALAYALRRWSLASVSVPVLASATAIVAGTWLGLELANATWLSFVLQVSFPMFLQLGFVFIGGQAGRLLTVRQMKEQFPRIVSGFVVGFFLAGLLAPPLLAIVGATERLLAGTCVCALALLGLVLHTRRLYPLELAVVDAPSMDTPHVSLRSLLARRLVLLLLGYQVLSMLGTQLVDFLVFDRAAARYKSSEDLARFTSVFTIVLNVVDLVFLAFVAGFLLRRFGMRLGLVVNPAVVTVLMVLGVVSGGAFGVGSIAMFLAVSGGRISDIALTDGATRTAINTAYQALPSGERLAVQATVEGIGGPGAIGVTGVILLIVARGFGGGPLAVTVITVVVGLVWTLAGAVVYRQYQTSLRDNLRSRVLRPVDLVTYDAATEAVVQRLLRSDPIDVAVALEVIAAQPDAAQRLAALASPPGPPDTTLGRDANAAARIGALQRLKSLDPITATRLALGATHDPDPAIRATAARVLADTDDPRARAAVSANADDGEPIVRLAAVVAHVRDNVQASDAMREEVLSRLHDDDIDVQAAAFRAAMAIGDESMMAFVVGALGSARTASMASTALKSAPDRYGAIVDSWLSDPLAAPAHLVRLVRSHPRATDPALAAVLTRHADHRSREVGLAVLSALGRVASSQDGARLVVAGTVTRADAAHAVRVLQVLVALGEAPEAQGLCDALADELLRLRRRALAAIGLVGDRGVVDKATQWLEGRDERLAALALETIEVTIPVALRPSAIPLLSGGPDHRRRLLQLARVIPSAAIAPALDDALTDLVEDAGDVWRRPWLQACALHAAVLLQRPVAARLVSWAAEMAQDGPVREIGAWARKNGALP